MLQGVRDNGRVLNELHVGDPIAQRSPEDLVEADIRLAAVRDEGRSLDEFSEEPAQRVMPHDLERAEESVKALEAMGIAFDPD